VLKSLYFLVERIAAKNLCAKVFGSCLISDLFFENGLEKISFACHLVNMEQKRSLYGNCIGKLG
jgi:hypothetical protein